MSFASGRIIQVAVLLQTDCKSEDKGVSGMRSLPSDIPQDTQNAVQQGRRRTLRGRVWISVSENDTWEQARLGTFGLVRRATCSASCEAEPLATVPSSSG